MAVDDLWYLRRPGVDGKRPPSKRYGRGKRWRVRYTDDLGRTTTRLFDKRAEADAYDAEKRTDVARGVYIDPVAASETVRSFGARWLTMQAHRTGHTRERHERTLRLHIEPVLGDLPLASVKRSTVQRWVNELDLKPSTARVAYSVLAAMMRAAVLDRAISGSPCTGIDLPAVQHRDTRILTPAQVHAVAEAVPAKLRAAVYLAAGCGMRTGEIFGLERAAIDLEAKEVRVAQQLVVNSDGVHLAPPKTATSRRTLDLPAWTAHALREHLDAGHCGTVALTDALDRRRPVQREAELLFVADQGGVWRRGMMSVALQRARAKVPECPPLTWHALRHYFATLLIFNGASVKSVQLALGHATPMVTLNTYVGLWPEAADRTRSLVDDALGEPPASE